MGARGPKPGTDVQEGSKRTQLGGPDGPKKAKGGRRAGSGQIPTTVKQALRDILDTPMKSDPQHRSRIIKAWDLLTHAMDAKDDRGQPNSVAVQAAEGLLDRYYGKAKMRMEVEGSGLGVLDLIEKVQADRLAKSLGGGVDGKRGP